jgi:hypothetical protein
MSNQNDVHSRRSSHREALLEHLFAGEVMKHLWLLGTWRLEILKPQVDDGGYDLVLEANAIIRHVQLKASFRGSKVSDVDVSMFLADKPSGCVVFLRFDRHTLELGPFAFFGGEPGQPLPSISQMKVGRHPKANSQGVKTTRPNIRTLPLSRFERLDTVEQIVDRLFGPCPQAALTPLLGQ